MDHRPIVLLVEWDENYRREAVVALERDGYRVIACNTSMEALDIAAREGDRIDILLCRVLMPPGNPHGLALSRMIRHKGRRDIRIVNYALHYDNLPEHEITNAPGELHPRPENGAELADLLKKTP
jgi:CheY-like chemotaxis protein